MWKTLLTAILLLLFFDAYTQRNRNWWTIYGGTQILPGTVYITAKQPAIGYGSGHTVVLQEKTDHLHELGLDSILITTTLVVSR
jgi:hypothetical protein